MTKINLATHTECSQVQADQHSVKHSRVFIDKTEYLKMYPVT